jgi:hypothetical protein
LATLANNKNERLPESAYSALLVIVVAIGFWLRFHCLGCLGFHGDEDLTSITVKALSESGVPELPSGMIYLRFYPYQWLLSLSTKCFGFSELSMRLPGVIFGTLLIPLAYYVARKMFDNCVGLIVAMAVAFSFEQVEVSRTARMYAPFVFVYLLAAYAIYQAHYVNKEKLWSPIAILLSILALTLHQLAYSLAIFYLAAILLRPDARRGIALFSHAAFVGISFILIKKFQEHYFYRARRLAEESTLLAQGPQESGGVLQSLLDQIALPAAPLLSQVVSGSPVLAIVFGALAVFIVVWCWRRSGNLQPAEKLVGTLAVAFSAVHQFNLALVAMAIMMIVGRRGLSAMRNASFLHYAVVVCVFFLAWTLIAFLVASLAPGEYQSTGRALRRSLRLLVDYPNYGLFWSFVVERPLLSLPLALGTLWGLDQVARKDPDANFLFLLTGFWGVLFANGILETKFEFFRYNLQLDVFFLVLTVIGILNLPTVYRNLRGTPRRDDSSEISNRGWLWAAGLVVILGVRPDMAYLTSHRDYYEDGWIYARTGLSSSPDFQAPAQFVRERMLPEDRVFVFDPREYWNYIGRVDYWIWSDNYQSQSYRTNSGYRDLYLGIPIVHTLADLRDLINRNQDRQVWILYTRSRLDRTRWVSIEIKHFVRSLDEHIVFEGRDRDTVVIRLDREDSTTVEVD